MIVTAGRQPDTRYAIGRPFPLTRDFPSIFLLTLYDYEVLQFTFLLAPVNYVVR